MPRMFFFLLFIVVALMIKVDAKRKTAAAVHTLPAAHSVLMVLKMLKPDSAVEIITPGI